MMILNNFFPDDEIGRDHIIVEVPINPKSPYEENDC